MSPEDHAADLARELVNNHSKFHSFGWHSEPADSERWCIVYTSNRDSGLLERSNARAIDKALEPFCMGSYEDGDCVSECHGHWAVGHVDGYAIRVYDAEGKITPAFAEYAALHAALEAYPVLDESDHSRSEYEATLENISSVAHSVLLDYEFVAPDGYTGEVFGWLWDNEQCEVESRDDQGGYPSEGSVERALIAIYSEFAQEVAGVCLLNLMTTVVIDGGES